MPEMRMKPGQAKIRRFSTLKRQQLWTVVLILMIFPAAWLEGLHKRARIERDDMVGTWIGLTTDELQMIRLTLGPQGDGVIGFSFMHEKPCVRPITSWTFDSGQIPLRLNESLGSCARDHAFHGVARGNELELTLRGSGWKRRSSLRKEEGLADRWGKLKAAMSPGS
jgi:hypothetical protein